MATQSLIPTTVTEQINFETTCILESQNRVLGRPLINSSGSHFNSTVNPIMATNSAEAELLDIQNQLDLLARRAKTILRSQFGGAYVKCNPSWVRELECIANEHGTSKTNIMDTILLLQGNNN
jgi:hypothetical protein